VGLVGLVYHLPSLLLIKNSSGTLILLSPLYPIMKINNLALGHVLCAPIGQDGVSAAAGGASSSPTRVSSELAQKRAQD